MLNLRSKLVENNQKINDIKRNIPVAIYLSEDSADDLTLLKNTPAQTESLLHSLEQAAGGISLYMNANKTEYVCLHIVLSNMNNFLTDQFDP